MFRGRNTSTTVRQIWHPQIVYLSVTFSYNYYYYYYYYYYYL